MIYNLADVDTPISERADVCIVGSGIAGLLLATKLRECGLRVLVLESGGYHQLEASHPLNQTIQLGIPYRGAEHGRARCLGGTSTRWGGALIPFLAEDIEARPHVGLDAWPVELSAVERYLPEVEALFKIDSGPFDEEFVRWSGAGRNVPFGDPDFVARFAKWPAFRRRNFVNLFYDRLARDTNLQVWLNATAINFLALSDRPRLESIVAGHSGEKRITVSASGFVICAGAIESTRLLLWLDRQYDRKIFDGCEALGRYFFDHISTPAADLEPKDVRRLNRMAGLRFVGGAMRSLRYELSPAAQRRNRVASAFGHIAVRTGGVTGFDALRALLQAVQQRKRIDPTRLIDVVKHSRYLVRAAAWRLCYRQLYWPTPARYDLHIVVEQFPYRENRIALAETTDALQVPLAMIDWRLHQQERDALGAYAKNFASFWTRRSLERVARLRWRFDLDQPDFDLSRPSDIFHPGGSTRMGRDARGAVVDENLRTFGIDNLWVASTSVFPSGPSANPTLMLMLLTLRLADHLAGKVSKNLS
jgi:choline dehydrogenase-like flavoprotein